MSETRAKVILWFRDLLQYARWLTVTRPRYFGEDGRELTATEWLEAIRE